MVKIISADPTQALAALKEMSDAALNYQKIKEIETTKRAQIEKRKQEALAKIHSQKEILLAIVQNKHAENMKVISGYLDKLDRAIELNDSQMVGMLLSGISDTLRNNPFASIKDMTDANGRLKIEI